MASASKHSPANRISSFGDSIWSEFTPLAIKTGSVNLGQGFPDWEIDTFVKEAFQKQASQAVHQYTRAGGEHTLVNTIANVYKDLFKRDLDAMKEVLVTNGASGGLYTCIQGLVNPGDEVILMEPFFDLYPANVTMSGAVPVYVSLREKTSSQKSDGACTSSQDWYLDEQDLRKAITSKTKLMIFNNPHNPTGKVFSTNEIEMICRVAKENDIIVISDEVYEFLVFGTDEKGNKLKHERIATFDGMWDRTLTVCSAGKTFSCTGWKIGWIIGPEDLIQNVQLVNQYSVYCVNSACQRAVAECLQKAMEINYLEIIQQRLKERCDYLMQVLEESGLKPVRPAAGYFALANIEKINFEDDYKDQMSTTVGRDYNFCRWLPKSIGIAAIPPSAFMCKEHRHMVEKYARFCFCKEQKTLEEAKKRFASLQKYTKK